ncbi:MAG: tetratricopeptide repeat protein, partial [Ignavibacteriales bacterium]|nr:tetratricopeptide repeat protein [Ignavibacteriales bacterium]
MLDSNSIFYFIDRENKLEEAWVMSGFDHFDDDSSLPRPKRRSDEDIRRFRDQLKNGEKDINNVEALEEIIQFYFEHEQFQEALQFAERLISFEPYSSDAWQRKGMILNNLFKYEEALSCYEKAFNLNPTNPEILVNKGITLDNLNRIDEALSAFNYALDLDPSFEEGLFHKGVTLEKQEKYEEAVGIFRFMLDVNPEH